MPTLEFWPDYGGVLLHADGAAVGLDGLGLRADLAIRAQAWVSRYDDSKVDPEGWDEAWVGEGRSLFQELSDALEGSQFEVCDWEGHCRRARARSPRCPGMTRRVEGRSGRRFLRT